MKGKKIGKSVFSKFAEMAKDRYYRMGVIFMLATASLISSTQAVFGASKADTIANDISTKVLALMASIRPLVLVAAVGCIIVTLIMCMVSKKEVSENLKHLIVICGCVIGIFCAGWIVQAVSDVVPATAMTEIK